MSVIDRTSCNVRDEVPDTDGSLQRVTQEQPESDTIPAPRTNPPVGFSDATPKPSSLEFALMAVWKSVLEVDEITVDDDFFLLGGDSLSAVVL